MKDKVIQEIRQIANNHFSDEQVHQFIEKFQELALSESLKDYLLQISTDEGIELELGFFTKEQIVDVTLSKGKLFFCSYPLSLIHQIAFTDQTSKSTLTIYGQKKFDYNVVKPGAVENLKRYEKVLKEYMKSVDPIFMDFTASIGYPC